MSDDRRVEVTIEGNELSLAFDKFSQTLSIDEASKLIRHMNTAMVALRKRLYNEKVARFYRLIKEYHYPERLAEDPAAKALFLKHTGDERFDYGACYCFAAALKEFFGLGGLVAFGYIVEAPGYKIDGDYVYSHVMLLWNDMYVDGNGILKMNAAKKRWFPTDPELGQPQIFGFFGVPGMEDNPRDTAARDALNQSPELIAALVAILKGYENGSNQ